MSESFTPGSKNSQVNSDMIIFPQLYIKLGLFKNFVKVMDKNGTGFLYLKENFSGPINTKSTEGVYVCLQIREL